MTLRPDDSPPHRPARRPRRNPAHPGRRDRGPRPHGHRDLRRQADLPRRQRPGGDPHRRGYRKARLRHRHRTRRGSRRSPHRRDLQGPGARRCRGQPESPAPAGSGPRRGRRGLARAAPRTGTPVPPGKHLAALRASWRGWTARVAPAARPGETAGTACVLAPIAAAALGVSEAFGAVRSAPGSDAGYRDIALNLWNPGANHQDKAPTSPTPRPPGGSSDSATSARPAPG